MFDRLINCKSSVQRSMRTYSDRETYFVRFVEFGWEIVKGTVSGLLRHSRSSRHRSCRLSLGNGHRQRFGIITELVGPIGAFRAEPHEKQDRSDKRN
jgi:hypothetical protein